jgi:hypothetical protein
MPVLSQHDVFEARRERVDDRNDLVAPLYREPAAGTEVVLHIDDDEGVSGARLDFGSLRQLVTS